MSETHEGRCLCGDVTYEVTTPVFRCVTCHCDSCRRNCAAPMTATIGVDDGQWCWTGAEPALFKSSPGVERRFCARCGTPMSFRAVHMTNRIHFYLGTLEDPEAFRPESHSFLGEKLSWLHLTDDLPANDDGTR